MRRAFIGFIAAAALLGAAVSASAGDQGDPGQDCGVSTPEMVECLNAQTAHWDKELTVAYQKAMKDALPAQKQQLRAAERAWIKYRDANCTYYSLGEGSIARIQAAECLRGMTEKRAKELQNGSDIPN